MTLAIEDGTNDINMIRVGGEQRGQGRLAAGRSGWAGAWADRLACASAAQTSAWGWRSQEGMQAVQNSDYVLASSASCGAAAGARTLVLHARLQVPALLPVQDTGQHDD